jgi:hypothetical protein
MREGKSVVRSILELPSSIVAAITNLESDWVRYGLPAVVLTVIFSFAMRFDAGNIDSSLAPSADTKKVVVSAEAKPSSRFSDADEAHPPISTGMLGHEAVATQQFGAPRPAQPYAQPPRSMTLSSPSNECRRALCGAVQYALARVEKKHRKMRAMQFAIEGCRAQSGGGQTGDLAVNSTLAEYERGIWDESQCPSIPGRAPLAKGAIAQVMR